MKTLVTIIISSFFLMASCHKEEIIETETDNSGVIIAQPYLWKTSLHNDSPQPNANYIKNTIVYNNNIGIPCTNGQGDDFLTLIDSNNGEILWQWDDRFEPETEDISIRDHYQHNNLLIYQIGSRSYCINLNNGTTHWKIRRDQSFHVTVSGLHDKFFILGDSETMYHEYQEQVVYRGTMQTGELEEYIIPDFTLEHIIGTRIGDVTRVEPYMYNGVQHLAITWQELTDDVIWYFQTYLGLYNYETDEWVYKKEIMHEPDLYGVVLAPPVIYKDRIYANISRQLVCHDLATGEQIWFRQFTQDFMFSGFIIEEDKIIANNEDTYTYCLNPDNGNTIWKTKSAGTSGRIGYLNGIVYFVGGSTGYLHAIEVSTGKTVWKIKGNSLDGSPFRPHATYTLAANDKQPARVVAMTSFNAYCYKAYQ